MKILLKWALGLFLFFAWLVFSAVLGGFVLAAKESFGLNIFSTTGYHSFAHCLSQEAEKAAAENLPIEPN